MQATAAPSADGSLLAQMRDQADKSVTITDQAATGEVGFVRTTGDLMPGRTATDASTAGAKADAYLDKYASLFGARPTELAQTDVRATPFGWTVKYQQSYQGVPVWAGEMKAHITEDGDLTAVTGYAAPDLSLDVTPSRSAADAASRAVAFVQADPPRAGEGQKVETPGLKAVSNNLVVYREGIVKGEAGDAVLAYDLEVSNITESGGTVRDRVILDANTLKPLNRYSMIADGLDRTLYTTNYNPGPPPSGGTPSLIWQEGDPLPGALDEDQQNLLASSADSYWMHMNTFGIDSYDNAGGERVTLHNRPNECPNASWNGSNTSYCAGVYADDVVAHEWGHAYTEYETGLIYQWQSGALNESYSDVWGETVDLLNGREDEGEGDLVTKRPDGLCSSHSPALPTLSIDSPASIAKLCLTGGASFGAPPTAGGLSGEVVIAADAIEAGGTATDGCSPYTNQAAVTGKIVMVDRGLCGFEEKAAQATAMGAAALIIGNRDDAPIGMSGSDTDLVTTVSIGLGDRETIRSTVLSGQPVTVTIKDATTADKAESYRWLIGEESTAFGGAIRDMWNPTCHGDPGKVSDAEYKCSSDDNGGVHGNSGVPNHGYALLVDGGSFNGQTVQGLGLDKAANIYFYAQNYMGPTSDFVDHADSLEQACADLTGEPIKELSFTAGAAPANADPITTADCAQVSAMINAIELRLDPTVKCKWKPLLDKGAAPALCGDGFTSRVVFSDDFDAGISAWTDGENADNDGGLHFPWRSTAVYPGKDNVGRVAYGAAPDEGDCAAEDISSSDSITSPAVLVPVGKALRLSFDHYVSTEAGFDGGNVKLSINDGDFEAIPAAAYVFNAPNTTITVTDNTSPLAGEPGFSGTNPGRATGSWGNSQVNLEAAGAKAGDSIEIQFDMGRDGCGGVDGWYVDNVSVTVCDDTNTTVTATHTPEPSVFGTASKIDVTVAADKGGAPTGAVEVLKADSTKVASGTLAAGKATIALPADLPVGTHVLTVNYAGSGGFKASSGTVTVTVKAADTPPSTAKADSKTIVKVRPSKPKAGQKVTFTVKVKADATLTGKVVIKVDGKKHTVRLKNGKATLTVKKGFKAGKHQVKVKYLGSDTVKRSSDTAKFKVKRR